jgi:PAS domain-containing protein
VGIQPRVPELGVPMQTYSWDEARLREGRLAMKTKRGVFAASYPYIGAVGLVLLATAGSYWFTEIHKLHNLGLYFLAVVVAAFYGGVLPSLLAIGLSAVSFAYFIAPPMGMGVSIPEDQFRLGSFVVVAALFCLLHGSRNKAEERVRSMAQRLSLALEATKLGVWDLNLATGVIWHSDGLEEVYGRDADHFARAYEVFLGFVHPDDRDFVHRTVTRAIENVQEYHIQHRIVLPNGEIRNVSTRGRVFRDGKGYPERLVAVATDVTSMPGVVLPPSAPVKLTEGAGAKAAAKSVVPISDSQASLSVAAAT